MHVRKFDGSASDPVPRPGTRRVRATVLQLPGAVARQLGAAELEARFHGAPLLVDRPTGVVALHFDTDAQIDEHAADEPILFVVVEGSGFVRISPSEGAASCPGATAACALLCGHGQESACAHDECLGESAVSAGDSVLWPAGLRHQAWTTDAAMVALAIHYGRES
jgi:quercetin dioxygenase-like cupin family protein